ncbi:MAG: alkaline phosphatase family protein [Pseudomonadota bacterium]
MPAPLPRTLILGFDGGDPTVFRSFDMPFLESLCSRGRSVDMCEDLLTRGWSEIVTGRTAEDTAGLYFRPAKGGGSARFHHSYSLREMLANPDVKAIWTLLNERGVRFGLMGVPTTSPAPEIDGFAIAGGGGGINKISGVPEGFCHPKALARLLDEAGYEFDVRVSTMAETSLTAFIERVEAVIASNVRALQAVARETPTEATFVCLRPTTGLQYLARHDIALAAKARDRGEPLIGTAARLAEHYRFLDDQIREIFEIVAPDHFILVADHGTAPYRKQVNLNAFLTAQGYQTPRRRSTSLVKSGLRALKRKLPRALTSRYGKTLRQRLPGMALNFDPSRTRAFGHNHVPGLYINDAERFGGPVNADEVTPLVNELCAALNTDPTLMAEGFMAHPFRRQHEGSFAERELPDIALSGPDTHFFVGTGPLIRDNPNDRATPQDLRFVHNPFSGIKGRNPILTMDNATGALVQEADARNMTLAYKLVDRIYAEAA